MLIKFYCCLLGLFSLMGLYAQQPPNIVVFIADDAGMEYGCYGDTAAHTPNIDALASQGVRFTKAFLTAPQCSPSRTSMLSGQFAHTIGTEDLHTGIDSTTVLVPDYLKEAGYFSGLMLKGHIGKYGMAQFDWYDEGFWPDWVRDNTWHDKALGNFNTFLDKAGDRPFFLWVGFVDPHRPYRIEDGQGGRAPAVNEPGQVSVPPYLVDSPKTREDLADYYNEISRMDGQIGDMMKALESRGLRENTIVLYLSDNGMPFPRSKGTLYDSGLQTPMIWSWPGHFPEGATYEGLSSTIDLAPTLLDYAGLERPEQMYGQSLRPVLEKPNAGGRKYVFGERNWHGADEHMRSIRTDSFLLILNSYIALPHGTPTDLSASPSWFALREAAQLTPAQEWLFKAPRVKVEFYDVINDPFQINNLSGKEAYLEQAKVLSKELVEWMKATGDHPPHERRRNDVVDRVSGFPVQGDRAFFEGYWYEKD
ncbi:sulfatase family protein [Phaeodactylibacter xiamenensis]|uniref:sulfatase family protein n=1 Tax=Phaeodactylibacter xiamenensis TaxID=1524460 RepID=UPI0024A8D35D|nr:sulfatase [Phaeodactylibacter xiamenensis]